MKRTRLLGVGLLVVGLGIGLTACMGDWFTPQQIATLIIGAPVAKGGNYEVLISVANMPNQGLAAMAVDANGMTYNNAKISNITATGLNGFTVLASQFVGGNGRFVIVNPATGVVGGTILKLTFNAVGTPTAADLGTSRFFKANITLGSNLNTLITAWTLGTTKAYYAK